MYNQNNETKPRNIRQCFSTYIWKSTVNNHVQITFDCTLRMSDLTKKISSIIVYEYLFYYFLMKFQLPHSNSTCKSDHSSENRDVKVNSYSVKKKYIDIKRWMIKALFIWSFFLYNSFRFFIIQGYVGHIN